MIPVVRIAAFVSLLFVRNVEGFASPTAGSIGMRSTLQSRKMATPGSWQLHAGSTPEDEEQRPDPSTLIAAKDDSTQRLAIGVIGVSLGIGTVVVVNVLEFLHSLLPVGWFEIWRDFTWPVPLGLIFLAIGITHFTFKDTYSAMVPPPGTWGGLWQVPAPGANQLNLSYADYHTYWTGVAEVGGGVWLILGGLGFTYVQIPALLLLLLTACVTPANIYMATHDIRPPRFPPIRYPDDHYIRGGLQCVIFALLWELSFQT